MNGGRYRAQTELAAERQAPDRSCWTTGWGSQDGFLVQSRCARSGGPRSTEKFSVRFWWIGHSTQSHAHARNRLCRVPFAGSVSPGRRVRRSPRWISPPTHPTQTHPEPISLPSGQKTAPGSWNSEPAGRNSTASRSESGSHPQLTPGPVHRPDPPHMRAHTTYPQAMGVHLWARWRTCRANPQTPNVAWSRAQAVYLGRSTTCAHRVQAPAWGLPAGLAPRAVSGVRRRPPTPYPAGVRGGPPPKINGPRSQPTCRQPQPAP